MPLFRRAIAMLRADDLSPQEGLRWLALGCIAAAELFDDQAQHALAIRWVRLARDHGALTALPVALQPGAFAEVAAGRFDAARACFAEGSEISAATGNPGIVGTAGVAEVYELAWRGRETDARRVAAAVAREATGAGRGAQSICVQYCLAVLELGLGNYQAALQCALGVYDDDAPFFGTLVLPDLVEAAARCGETGMAEAALGRLAERAAAAGTPLALGLLARSRALLAGDADAELLYEEAIGHLKQCRAAPQLARAHLVYGEWLRRQRRRRDAREQLRTAHEMFTAMGAGAFAERARVELLATGERARQRTAETEDELTPQEAQIARLVSQGDSNRDIAAQLFLSPSTVDYHLRKVFRKTGVTSRTQLARTMADGRHRGLAITTTGAARPSAGVPGHGRGSRTPRSGNRRSWSDDTSSARTNTEARRTGVTHDYANPELLWPRDHNSCYLQCARPPARATLLSVPLRCLIVDDNAYFLEAAADLLKREGLTVAGVASDSADALRLTRELRPNVVLVDIMLGHESGIDLARRLAGANSGGPVIILISTHAEADFADLIQEAPVAGFVPKSELSASAIRRLAGV